jgi:phosphoribosylanthranilate isomerase
MFSVERGVGALGFNFYQKSPRRIDTGDAAKIIKMLPNTTLAVGVFVNESIERILEIAAYTRLDAIQLHGDESPEFIIELKKKIGLEIIKAIRVSPGFAPQDVLRYKADAILLDAYSKDGYGGTGETFDWKVARKVQRLMPRMYLAGGLSPDNIWDAVKTVRPYGVDACSRLERAPGLKDHIKIQDFIHEATRPL